jgi:hypothetical protein
MKTRKSFPFLLLAVIAVGLVAGATLADRIIHRPVHYAQAAWAEIFPTPARLGRSVDAIVLAQALDVTPAASPRRTRVEGGLPFQLVELEVLHGIKGAVPGDRLIVERAGGVDLQGQTARVTADGGELAPGEVYLLFLKQQPDGPYYYQVKAQGRYHLEGNHLIAVDPDDPVATRLHGVTMEEGLARVQAALGAADRPEVFKK